MLFYKENKYGSIQRKRYREHGITTTNERLTFMNIVNLFDPTGLIDSSYGPKYSAAEKEIAKSFEAKNIGFHLEVMNPKTFSCPYHYHTKEEELCIVIEGEAIVRNNNLFRKVKAGDLIYYGTGIDSAHHMYNHTDKPFKYFVLSTKFGDELCHYPDSKKTLDKKNRTVTQNGVAADYFKDEEDPSIHWPAEVLKGNIS